MIKVTLDSIVRYLNENTIGRREIIRYCTEVVISIWDNIAFVYIDGIIYTICEGGQWFIGTYNEPFAAAWLESYIKALTRLQDYLMVNGSPVYSYGESNEVAYYKL